MFLGKRWSVILMLGAYLQKIRGNIMIKDTLLKQAIDLMEGVNVDELESVTINHYTYEDGTSTYTIDLNYLALKEVE